MKPSHAIFTISGWIAYPAYHQMDAAAFWGAAALAGVGLWAAVVEAQA